MKTYSLPLLIACIAGIPLNAQWLKQRAAGIPRTPAGLPMINAPAPRTADGHPDLSGLWRRSLNYAMNVAPDLKPGEIAPWARALAEKRSDDLAKDNPAILCLPAGTAYLTSAEMARFIQSPSIVAILHPDLTYRQIFMDGRALEPDPNPSFMGYSVGRWDGDTLVVESNGFNDRTWLDVSGHPHTEALRTTERYRRLSLGRMELQVTFEDPKVYARPWTVTINMFLATETEMLEYVCAENERSRQHLVGTVAEIKAQSVKLSPETLASFAGTYGGGLLTIRVELEQSELKMIFAGVAFPLIPTSETSFSTLFLRPVEFRKDDQGAVTAILVDLETGPAWLPRTK
jgi:hypothetical protein